MGDVVSSEEIVRRLDAALERRRGERVIVVTDADGTLWSGDVGDDILKALVVRRAIRDEAREGLAAEALAHGVDASGDANDIGTRLHAAFEAGRWPEDRAFETTAWAFAGYRLDEVRSFARDVLAEVKL